ncbi:uncharacterized protein LOC111903348 [Lactuca sativa]|uniref:uncharacterized protein LOC111903348 n=1 Tax=Lactuca sativa TaxID=4236 RepID=UPI000CD83EA6|nr:uncharacterized protein LOC111903348 [Lactuca sativa]
MSNVGGAASVNVKEVGSTTIVCPMLSSTNYTVWALRMKVVFKIHKAWTVIDPRTEKNGKKDYLAMGLLYQAIPETLIMQIGDVESLKVLWDAIKAMYVGADRVKEARLQTLMVEFDRLNMSDSELIHDFTGRLSRLASKSVALGEVIDETKLVKKFLNSLPRLKFIHIVSSLEQVLDLKSVGFEDVVGRLKSYEERIGEEGDDGGQEPKVLWSSSSGGTGSGGGDSLTGGAKERSTKGKGMSTGNHGFDGLSGSSGPKGNNNRVSQISNRPNHHKSNSDLTQPNSTNCKKCNCCCDKNQKIGKKTDLRLFVFGVTNRVTFPLNVRNNSKKLKENEFSECDNNDETVF